MSVLIWSQTVCKGYQQMTKVAFNMIILNSLNDCFLFIFLSKIFQELYQTLKQCVPRSGPTFCRSVLILVQTVEKVISRHTLSEASEVRQSY